MKENPDGKIDLSAKESFWRWLGKKAKGQVILQGRTLPHTFRLRNYVKHLVDGSKIQTFFPALKNADLECKGTSEFGSVRSSLVD